MWQAALTSSVTFAIFVLTTLLSPARAAPVSVTDDIGSVVMLPKPAERIATLAPSLTELVYTAGAGGKLVAVSAYSDFPAAAKNLPQIADAAGVSLEALLAIKPDLVIAWKSGNREADIRRVAELGIPVLVLEVAHLSDVPRAIRMIGRLAATENSAEAAAGQIDAAFNTLRLANRDKPKVTVFFEISRLPLMTINRHHAIDEVISLCAGENIFRDKSPLVFVPSMEELIQRQPEAVLFPADEMKPPSQQYSSLRAWDAKRIYRVGADVLLRTGPRLVEGAQQVCAALDQARRSTAASGHN